MLNKNDICREHLFRKFNSLHELVEKSASVLNAVNVSGRKIIDTTQLTAVKKSCEIVKHILNSLTDEQVSSIKAMVYDTIKVWCKHDQEPLDIVGSKRLPALIRGRPQGIKIGKQGKQTEEMKLEEKLLSLGEFGPMNPIALFTNYGMSQLYEANFIDSEVKNSYMSSIVTLIPKGTAPTVRNDDSVYCYVDEITMNESGTEPKMMCFRKRDKIIHMTCMPRNVPQPMAGEDPFPANHYMIGVTFSAPLSDRYFNEVKKYTPFHLYKEYVSRLFVIREMLRITSTSPVPLPFTKVVEFKNYVYGPDLYQKFNDFGGIELITGLVYQACEWAGVSAKSKGKNDDEPDIGDFLDAWLNNETQFRGPHFVRKWRENGGARSASYITPYDIGYEQGTVKGIHAQSMEMLFKQRDKLKAVGAKLNITPLPGVETDQTYLLQPAATSTHAYHRMFACLTASIYVSGISDLPGLTTLYRGALKAVGRDINGRVKKVDKVCGKLARLLMSLRKTEIPADNAEIPLPTANINTPFEPRLEMKEVYDMTSEVIFATKALKLAHPYIKYSVGYEFTAKAHGGYRKVILNAIADLDEGFLVEGLREIFEYWDGSIGDNLDKHAIHGMNNSMLRVLTALQRPGLIGGFNQMGKEIYPGLSRAEKIAKHDIDSDVYSDGYERMFIKELKANFSNIRTPAISDLIEHSRKAMKSASAGGDNISVRDVLTENVLRDSSRQEKMNVVLKSKIALPGVLPTLFLPRPGTTSEEGKFEINRLSTPTRPYPEGTRRVPGEKDDRSVKNFATGCQILLGPLYDAMTAFQALPENEAYLLAHNSGIVGKDAARFMRDSLRMTVNALYIEGAYDYKTFDQFYGRAAWNAYVKALTETLIGTHPDF